MMTVNEVSRLTGVSIRALHYYDQIGLLPATGHTDSGYRLYDDTALGTFAANPVVPGIGIFAERAFSGPV